MNPPAALLTRLIIEIQTKANEIAEASRSHIPEGGKSDPNLNLERLIQQAEADAEIAGYCTTEKSRQNRRDALVRSAASSLLALFVMDRKASRCTCPPGTWSKDGAVGDASCPEHGENRDGRTIVFDPAGDSTTTIKTTDPTVVKNGFSSK